MHRKRIARGACFLDREFPGWERMVEVEILDPENDRNCVIGQVTGNFERFMERRYFVSDTQYDSKWLIALKLPFLLAGARFILRYGLSTVRETDSQWVAAWTEEVQRRRAGGRPIGKIERLRRRWTEEELTVPEEWTSPEMSERSLSGRMEVR